MANLNLGQDVANKREREKIGRAGHTQLAKKMSRDGSLININPSGSN